MRKNYLIILISLIVIILDQLTKYLARTYEISIQIIKDFLYLKYTTNTGAAFGILQNYTFPLILFSIAVLGVFIYYFDKLPENKYILISVGLFIGGLIGNLIDRIFFKHVIDFIAFTFWPAFNIADSCIVIGVIGLVIWTWKR